MPDGIRTGVAERSQKSVLWRQVVAFTVAFLFGLSNYFVQSHVHIPSTLAAGVHSSFPGQWLNGDPNAKHRSGKDDPADCPLCQADILSGAFVTPAPIIFVPIISYVLTSFLPIRHVVRLAHLSHDWYGRAPPRL